MSDFHTVGDLGLISLKQLNTFIANHAATAPSHPAPSASEDSEICTVPFFGKGKTVASGREVV